MKRMLFETSLIGHRLEYIHHIYMGMCSHSDDEYVIVVPKDFEEKRGLYEWPKADNIRFVLMDKSETGVGMGGVLKASFSLAKLLKKYIKQENVEAVFLPVLMGYIPALPFLISSKIRVSGIIYKIYLYEWKRSSWRNRVQDIIKYCIMRYSKCLKTVYMLNDASAAVKLNKLYNTSKFKFITDPYNAINYQAKSIRSEFGAKEDDMVFLHFGGLDYRKGTLDILNSIKYISKEKKDKCVFVFAGRVYDQIKEKFYGLINECKDDVRIVVYDQFCSNELLADLIVSSNYILLPYRSTSQSSGLLGHAAHYGVPVVGPSDGLIGKLIRKNRLGVQLPSISPECIANTIQDIKPCMINSRYKEAITIDLFNKTIFSRF